MLIFKGKPENGPVYHATLSESMLHDNVEKQSIIVYPDQNTFLDVFANLLIDQPMAKFDRSSAIERPNGRLG